MRPTVLNPLFALATSLSGVGPKQDKLLRYLLDKGDTPRLVDLLLHLPSNVIDRRARPKIRDAVPGTVATLEVTVDRHRPSPPGRARVPYVVYASDDTGDVMLTYFRAKADYIDKILPVGAKRYVSGTVQMFDGTLQMVHPDRVVDEAGLANLPGIEPVYPLTEGLALGSLRRAVAQALQKLPALPEWISPEVMRRCQFPPLGEALHRLHAPLELTDILPNGPYWSRLAYDELLAGQLALALVRAQLRRPAGVRHAGDGHLRNKVIDALPYALTSSQREAAAAIANDLQQPVRMLRLLQGDVGSGKTVVALLAAAAVAEAGKQAALMAPTEVLAKQHHRTLSRFCPEPVALLTGSVKGKDRSRTLRGLQDGSIRLVVGTHALFQDAVAYHDLALAVIDEQHRFGVDQRLSLGDKGALTDVLVMTATPIPRSLLLTQWGEMDVSRLTGKPAGRQPIRTTLHSVGTLPDVLDGIARALDRGAQVYWVCPLVAESEALDLAAAEDRHAALSARFGACVGLAHGQQAPEVRDAELARFSRGEIRLLVATTVVEVGVDVPSATIMVIEHAERFGLAQLHQLRGRVGRGAAASFCLLVHDDWLPETARRRLMLLRDTEDGFVIADEDFRIRGGGDALGTRQAGLPRFRLADPVEHEPLLAIAHRDAQVLLARDPKLATERGRAARVLLRLFERHAAMKTLAAG